MFCCSPTHVLAFGVAVWGVEAVEVMLSAMEVTSVDEVVETTKAPAVGKGLPTT